MKRRLCLGLAVASSALALAGPLLSADASFSGSNGVIVFADRSDGQIYSIRPDGGDITKLTRGSQKGDPSWSPDGTTIVYYEQFDTKHLYVMDADGQNAKQVFADGDVNDREPSFSPDGTAIVFTRCPPDGGCRIATVNADGTAVTDVTNPLGPRARDTAPKWSPDGDWIAYECRNRNGFLSRVCLVRPDGTDLHAITPSKLDAGAPDWSPDGSRIAFQTYIDTVDSTICTIRPSGKGLRFLTPAIEDHNNVLPTWSPSGKKVLFSSDRDHKSVGGHPGGGDLFTVDADGSNLKLVIERSKTRAIYETSWQPTH